MGRVDGLFSRAHKVEKATALTMPLLQINGPRCIRYLAFDIDRPFAGLAWEDANLPIPNLVLINPQNGHAHLVWELDEPIWLRKKGDMRPGDAKPVRYLRAVQKAMGEALKADFAYNGLLVKNPFHSSWTRVNGSQKPYTLAELSLHLELNSTAHAKEIYNPKGRNSTLFDSIRLWGYRAKSQFDTFDTFHDNLFAELERLNEALPYPVSSHEIRYIGRSVSSWVWNTYTGNGKVKRRGIMQLDPTEDIRLRQQKGQAYTCKIRTDKTFGIIGSAIQAISLAGLRVTIAEVHRRTRLARNTIQAYWSRLTDTLTSNNNHETVSLRDKSSSEGASPRQVETLIATQLSNTALYTFDEMKEKHRDDRQPSIRAILYAIEQARIGNIVEGVPQTLKKTILEAVDKWRQQESSIYEQPTSQ